MTNLNKLIGAAAETYHLNSAMAINDNGQIVASALSKATGTRRAVLLTPISPVLLGNSTYNTGFETVSVLLPSSRRRFFRLEVNAREPGTQRGAKQREQAGPDKSDSGLTFKR